MRAGGDEIEEAAMAIARYLSRRPQASDTARGIAQVWLQQRYALETVQTALELLESRGAIRARRLSGGGQGSDLLYSAVRSGAH